MTERILWKFFTRKFVSAPKTAGEVRMEDCYECMCHWIRFHGKKKNKAS